MIKDYHFWKDLLELTEKDFKENFDQKVEETKNLDENEKKIQIQSLKE